MSDAKRIADLELEVLRLRRDLIQEKMNGGMLVMNTLREKLPLWEAEVIALTEEITKHRPLELAK